MQSKRNPLTAVQASFTEGDAAPWAPALANIRRGSWSRSHGSASDAQALRAAAGFALLLGLVLFSAFRASRCISLFARFNRFVRRAPPRLYPMLLLQRIRIQLHYSGSTSVLAKAQIRSDCPAQTSGEFYSVRPLRRSSFLRLAHSGEG